MKGALTSIKELQSYDAGNLSFLSLANMLMRRGWKRIEEKMKILYIWNGNEVRTTRYRTHSEEWYYTYAHSDIIIKHTLLPHTLVH